MREELQRLIYREFLLEPGLYREAGLEQLPEQLAPLLGCAPPDALPRLVGDPLLGALDLTRLKALLAIRDMTLISRTAAAVAAELKDPAVSYDTCCQRALCYAVAGLPGHVAAALRAAAAKHPDWARHHYLSGLAQGVAGEGRAREELDIALQHEPYEDGRIRIRRAIDILEGRG